MSSSETGIPTDKARRDPLQKLQIETSRSRLRSNVAGQKSDSKAESQDTSKTVMLAKDWRM